MEVDSGANYTEPGDHDDKKEKPTKKRKSEVDAIDYGVENAARSIAVLRLDGPHSASTSDDDEPHVLGLPDCMVTPRLIPRSSYDPYLGLGELPPELHYRICQHLPQNDVWNLSRCNRPMSVSFPETILNYRTRGVSSVSIANQLSALRRTPNLRKLSIDSFRSTSPNWARDLVTQCPHLKHIRLVNCHIPVLGYAALGFMTSLKSLEIENSQVDDFHVLFSAPVLSALATPTPFTSLSSDEQVQDADMNPAPKPVLFPSLERLSVVPMRTYELAIIVSHIPNLRKLKATLEAEAKPSKYLASACTSLQSLTLNTTYSDKVMPIEFVKTFRILSTLQTLDLSTGVDDNNIHILCQRLKGLTTLRIKNAHNLGDVGLDAIRTLPNLNTLLIDFGLRVVSRQSRNQESDLSWVVKFKSMKSLTSLTLLMPDTFALKFLHETLRQHLYNLQHLQLGSIVWSAQ